jgi:amino acid permease
LIIGFGVIGIIAFSIMQSLGELTTLYPTGGAFTGLADRFVDKAFGVALGWNYFIIWLVAEWSSLLLLLLVVVEADATQDLCTCQRIQRPKQHFRRLER